MFIYTQLSILKQNKKKRHGTLMNTLIGWQWYTIFKLWIVKGDNIFHTFTDIMVFAGVKNLLYFGKT